jgi:mRNA-degrading endonuclease toxin of MazEF toxin-antitoxin module
MKRGDIVVAIFPYVGGVGTKNRPAVVLQCDRLNQKLQNTIVAMITGNTRLVGREPTQFLIDPASAEGKSTGLGHVSAVKCENLMTIPQADILRTLGHLSDVLKQKLSDCVKAALELS